MVNYLLPNQPPRFLKFMPYADTVYACQDREDDMKLGLGSSAIAMNGHLWGFLSYCAFMFISLLTVSIRANGHNPKFCALVAIICGLEMIWQIQSVHTLDPKTCKGA